MKNKVIKENFDLHNRICGAISKGLNEALTKFDLDDFDFNDNKQDITLDKDKATHNAMNRIKQREWIQENFVDLGLPSGTLWCKYNLGANNPEEIGNYYAWGEIEPKDEYSFKTYKWYDIDKEAYSEKYDNTYGSLSTLLDEDDAANHINQLCNTPKEHEWQELFLNTTYELISDNTHKHLLYKLMSNHNENYILLPVSFTYMCDHDMYNGSRAYYWSASISRYTKQSGAAVSFGYSHRQLAMLSRIFGAPIRPIIRKDKL